jgi:hypothetical protein
MNALRNSACIMLAAMFFLASPAYSAAFSADQSDLYYIPAESGWGLQLVQRGSVIFATLFVYDSSGKPTWYTATMDYTSNLSWTGVLYATTGTYFESTWEPSALTVTPVGSMTWYGQFVQEGQLSYVVNGVAVVKNVVRQTLVAEDYSGAYLGAFHETLSQCTDAALDGTTEFPASLQITQSGTTVSIAATYATPPNTCAYSGALSQFGQFGNILGNYTCTSGDTGTFNIFELQENSSSVSGQFVATSSSQGCQDTGYFGAMLSTLP